MEISARCSVKTVWEYIVKAYIPDVTKDVHGHVDEANDIKFKNMLKGIERNLSNCSKTETYISPSQKLKSKFNSTFHFHTFSSVIEHMKQYNS